MFFLGDHATDEDFAIRMESSRFARRRIERHQRILEHQPTNDVGIVPFHLCNSSSNNDDEDDEDD